jgi:hypothetical protein
MLKLRDYTKIKIPNTLMSVDQYGKRLGKFDLQQYMVDNATAISSGAKGVGLELSKILTSMSGVLINGRTYPGVEWQKAAPYFDERPILLHHDKYSNPIGRLNPGVFEPIRKGRGLTNDWKNPQKQELGVDLKPSGILYTSGLVGDMQAIEQLQDKRLLHVSQGSGAQEAKCSICGSDWAQYEFCTHDPFKWYDEENEEVDPETEGASLMYLIVRGLVPKEVSFVTDPALREAKVMEFGEINDSVDMDMLNHKINKFQVADNILPESELTSFSLVDRNGSRYLIDLVDEAIPEITTSQNKDNVEVSDINNEEEDSTSSNTGVDDMDWEKKFQDSREELFSAKADLKDLEIKATKAEALVDSLKTQLETKDKEFQSFQEKSENEGKELKESLEETKSALNKVMDEVKTVYLDRYVAALKLSRPDLDDEALTEARKDLEDKALESIKILTLEKEKFAKAPVIETTDSKIETQATQAGDTTETQDGEPGEQKEEEEEEDSSFTL